MQITRRPVSPRRALYRSSRWTSTVRHAVRDDLHAEPGHVYTSGKKFGGNVGHDHDALAVGRRLRITARHRIGLGQQRVQRGDDRFAAGTHKIQDAIAPFAGIQAEFVLQADHVARAVVGNFGGAA